MIATNNREANCSTASCINPNVCALFDGKSNQSITKWSIDDDRRLSEGVHIFGEKNWKGVSEYVGNKSNLQCRQRWLKCTRPGIKKGKWSDEEDKILSSLMTKSFHNWRAIADMIPGRTSKQCRDRWNNYLSPKVNKEPFTTEEDEILMNFYEQYGNHWAKIAQKMPGRTENQVRFRVEHLKLSIKSKNSIATKQKTVIVTNIGTEYQSISQISSNQVNNNEQSLLTDHSSGSSNINPLISHPLSLAIPRVTKSFDSCSSSNSDQSFKMPAIRTPVYSSTASNYESFFVPCFNDNMNVFGDDDMLFDSIVEDDHPQHSTAYYAVAMNNINNNVNNGDICHVNSLDSVEIRELYHIMFQD